MRKFELMTTFHRKGYDMYGKRMIESVLKYWPKEIDFTIYWEEVLPDFDDPRLHYVELYEACPALTDFKTRHKDHLWAHGKAENPRSKKKMSGQDFGDSDALGERGWSFKHDAVRFSHKVYAQCEQLKRSTADVLIFLDADTVTFRPIPIEFFDKMLPEDRFTTFLGRKAKEGQGSAFSETGFIMYNLNHKIKNTFADDLRNLYNSDKLFRFPYQVDCYTWDWTRLNLEKKKGVKNFNLADEYVALGKKHPFINSPLGDYMDHLKGNRKLEGRSKLEDIKEGRRSAKQQYDYWKT